MPDEPTNEKLDDKMRDVPTDPPEVVPAQAIEQPALGAAIGLAAFAKQNPEGGLTGDEDEAWHVQPPGSGPTPANDNDQDSHVLPTDNDGETVPD